MLFVDTDAESANGVACAVTDRHYDRAVHSGLPGAGSNISRLVGLDVAGGYNFVALGG
jgi:hypothetical protein